MRTATRRVAPLALLLAAGCGDPLAPLPSEGPPRALEYEQYAWPGFGYTVRLAGDTVTYVETRMPGAGAPLITQRRHVPSADEWRAFWRAVREAGVRQWPRGCSNTDVLDGGGFLYTLAWDGGHKEGSFGNAYPTLTGRCSDEDAFASDRFAVAVLAIARAPSAVDLRPVP